MGGIFGVCKGFRNAELDYWHFDDNEVIFSFFGVVLSELVLCHSDNLSRTLQASHIYTAEGQKIATMTVKTDPPVNENFTLFWSKTGAHEFDISDLVKALRDRNRRR